MQIDIFHFDSKAGLLAHNIVADTADTRAKAGSKSPLLHRYR
jgi:hypothetical protein